MRTPPLIVFLLVTFCVNSQSFEWVKSIGGIHTQFAQSVAVDEVGNVYTVGYFNGTADFDPSPATYNLTSLGGTASSDIFVQKIDPSGNFVWAKTIKGNSDDYAEAIVVDLSGNIYITGCFQGTADFDPGAPTFNLTSAGGYEIFIQKMDSSGNFIWAKSFGGSAGDQGKSLCIDSTGNIYITGFFQGTVDFDPGAGINNLASTGYDDTFVLKLDSSGSFIWARSFGNNTFPDDAVICVDGWGNIYTTGSFGGTVDFDPGTGINNLTSTGGTDVYVQKLDDSGNFIWAKSMGGTSFDEPSSIAVDTSGNVYTAGIFHGTSDYDPGIGVFNLSSTGDQDIFIQKMDSSGNFIWAKSFGGTSSSNQARSITVDDGGNVYTTGSFSRTVDFNPGIGIYNLTPVIPDYMTLFVQKMDASGNFLWARSVDGDSGQEGSSITIDNLGNIYTVGHFMGNADLNLGTGTNTLTSIGNWDVFIQKMSYCPPISSVDTQVACDSYVWIDGNTYTTSNDTTLYTLISLLGCDSIVSLDLTIINSSSGIHSQVACESFTWIDGNTYTSSTNTPTFVLQNAVGCDSIVTLNLIINNSTTGIDTQIACESFTWIDGNNYTSSTNTPTFVLQNTAGCDSTIMLNLTINNSATGIDTQLSCDSLTWIDGITYYSSTNTPTWTLTNAAGCDSIVTLNLTILPSIPTIVENMFSMPSDANNCLGEFAVDISGNVDFELDMDNGAQTTTSSGYTLFTGICPGVHDLQIINFCGDTTTTQFVIPVDSNYVFTNPFIDSLAQDSLGVTLENCYIYYNGIDTAYIDSIWANGNTVNVIWNIVDSNGSNFDTTTYELNNGNGVYYLQVSVFCPNKALGEYFTVTQAIYFADGNVSSAGLSDLEENSVWLYPNPTNDQVTISFDGNEAELTIYDAQGKLIQASTIISGQQVSLNTVESGVYLFDLQLHTGRVVNRIIKN